MGRRRKFALVLLCATVTGAGWCAARLGGFEWSGIEGTARAIWDRAAARAATISSPDAGPAAIASLGRVTTSYRKLPGRSRPARNYLRPRGLFRRRGARRRGFARLSARNPRAARVPVQVEGAGGGVPEAGRAPG